MEPNRSYTLPKLPYDYSALAPSISEEQLRIHHTKHHQGYVNGANAIYEKLDKTRKDGGDIDQKATLKELSFHVGGFLLHALYWENMAPAGHGGGVPKGALGSRIEKEFGSFDRFKKEFTAAANSVRRMGRTNRAGGQFGTRGGCASHRCGCGRRPRPVGGRFWSPSRSGDLHSG